MILETKKFFFRKLNIILEDRYFDNLIDSGSYKNYGSVVALSYRDLSLPNFFKITKKTALIDLTQSEEGIFAKFSSTTRNEVSKFLRNHRLVFKSEDDNFQEIYSLYKDFEFSQGRVPIGIGSFKKYPIFSAYYDGIPISAISIMSGSQHLRIRSIFSKRLEVENKEFYKTISNATRGIVWGLCKWGKENSFKSLDMASVNLDNPKTASIARFKMTFGGSLVNEHAYIYKSKMFHFFEHFVKIKSIFARLFNSFKNS